MGFPPSCEVAVSLFLENVRGKVYESSTHLRLLHVCRIDDAVDAIPVHMFGGAWGVIATGLFSSPQRIEDWLGRDTDVGYVQENDISSVIHHSVSFLVNSNISFPFLQLVL